MKVLRNRKDIRTLLLTAVGFSLQIFCFLNFKLQLSSISFYFLFAFVGFWASTANHMHQHHPIFHSRNMNRLLNLVYSLMFGAPATRLHAIHLWNHHAHYNSPQYEKADWSHFYLAGSSRGLWRSMTYVVRSAYLMAKNRGTMRLPAEIEKAQKMERVFLWIMSAVMLWLNPVAFLLLVLPCWVLSLGVLLTANLINHDECETQSEIYHSRDFLNKFENWIFLNSGYHSAHHDSPACHWSELPDVHTREFSGKKKQIEASFFSFLLVYYILPRERRRN